MKNKWVSRKWLAMLLNVIVLVLTFFLLPDDVDAIKQIGLMVSETAAIQGWIHAEASIDKKAAGKAEKGASK